MNNGKLILIDGNSLLYRAFFAMPHFSTLSNQPTNAVYGFTMMLLAIINEEKPDVILVAFDAPVKTFRHLEFADYKAHRKPTPDELSSQGPLAREMVAAFNIPVLEVEGVEADDVVGTLARRAESEGYDVLIVTGDMDALQLVDERVKVMSTIKGVSETVIYDEAAVEERYGLRPEQLVDYKALKGDPSDNIPGVPGVGDKTARQLVKEYGNMENVLAAAPTMKPSKVQGNLVEYAEQAILSKRLATIVMDVPIDIELAKCRFKGPNTERLREIFTRLEFRSLLKRLPDEKKEEKAQGSLFDEVIEHVVECVTVESREMLPSIFDEAGRAEGMVIRVEGSSPRGVDAEPLGMALAFKSGETYFLRFGDDLHFADLRDLLGSDKAKYGHNLKYELEIGMRLGVEIAGPAFDVMLAAYLLNPSRNSHALAVIAFDYLGLDLSSARHAEEADAVRRLVPVLGEKLVENGLGDLMANVEMPLVPILAEMETRGVSVDTEWLGKLSERMGERIAALESEIHELAGMEFNINSTQQLQIVLFEKLGLPTGKKTKTGYSTDADTLAALAPAHEIVAKILEYRELTKLKSTYADALPKLISPRTGRIHTSFNQAVTTTGRLSSSEPNLQNIPIKSEIGREIRKAFIASPGNMLVSADYSQIELRILAHVSGDPELVRAFREGIDIHTRTASGLFDVPADQVTSDMRRQAKTVNFAVIYGMSDYGLSRELNIPPSVAKRYIEEYFAEYPGVRRYAERTVRTARERGYVESLAGRKRYMPELTSPNRSFREFAERAAVNMPIQGTAADIVKIAMIRVHERLGPRAGLILQVHDELVFDLPESEVAGLLPVIKRDMEGAFALDVPLLVEVKVGPDWCTAQPVPNDY
ncbi:MAG: DNA polymerase I [Armatimonadota bacterium]